MLAPLAALLRTERLLVFSISTSLVFFAWGGTLLGDLSNPAWLMAVFLWLFIAVLASAFSAVRHADHLAESLGEPYGTLILTLSVTFIEVAAISAVMLHGDNNPTLTRDTLLSVLMIVLNGMVGLSLLLGGWRHREQHYNLRGANAYLSVIIPLAVLSLIMPDYTQTTAGPTLSRQQEVFLMLVSVGLYSVFLAMQTGRHRMHFILSDETSGHAAARGHSSRPYGHMLLLMAYIIPVVFLAEQLAKPIDYLIETLKLPTPFGGVIIAVLVTAPEAMGAVRAAMANHMQRAVNIFLGSVLSTIGLTVPAMILVSRLTGRDILLGIEHVDFVLLLLTLAVSVVTFTSGHTNVIQGAVHLVLFATYVALFIQG